jgi:hypothetical protein
LDAAGVKLSDSQQRVASLAVTALAYLFLQLSLGIFYWLPEHSVAVALRPSLDALLIVGFFLLLARAPSRFNRIKQVLAACVAPWIALSVMLGVAQGIARRSFAYDFTLAYHMSKVQALLKMMYEAQSLPVFILCMVLLVGTIVLVTALAAWAIRRFYAIAQLGNRETLHVFAALAGYSLVAGAILGFNGPVASEVVSQINEAVHREERTKEEAKRIVKVRQAIAPVQFGDDVKRPTVLVFVVESYGNILFEAPKYQDFHKVIAKGEQELVSAGYTMRSRTYLAPVFGGSSWLANATFLCRTIIPTEKVYFSLFKTNMPCLPRPFNGGGYHSVFAGSNTTVIDDEYAALFPFESFYARDDFPYEGPRMSWSYMPDQYIIDQIETRVLSKESDRPHFVYYKLSSSHHPWDTIPPFLEDWSTVGDGSIYKSVASKRYRDNAFIGGKHLNEGYYDSIVYSLTTIFDYLETIPKDREFIAVVFGDHQPRGPVAEMDKDPWTVPLHVISRDKDLIDRFSDLDYTKGLFTTSKEPIPPGLETIPSHLIRMLNDSPSP